MTYTDLILMPKISVTMPVFNGAKTIRRAIVSLQNQSYIDWELIVVDGYSTDSTLSEIEKLNDFRIRVFQCEKKGIYNAINFGIRKSRGQWIMNLNSDDFFEDTKFLEKYTANITPTTEVLYSNLRVHANGNVKFVSGKSHLSFLNYAILGWLPPHPSYLIRADLLKRHLFDETYRISGDYDWFIRVVRKYKVTFSYVPDTSVAFSTGGISTNFRNLLASFIEDCRAVCDNMGHVYVFVPILKKIRKFPRKVWEAFGG